MDLKNIIRYGILFILPLLHSGCERDEFTWGTKVGSITFSGNVIFLDAADLALLKEVSENRLTFSGKTQTIEDIYARSILVMGVSEKTPYGLLRRVTDITSTATEVIVTTTPAHLADAVKEGTIRFYEKLLEENFRLKSKTDNVIVGMRHKDFDGLAVTLDSLVIFENGTNSAILNGGIGISSNVDISIDIAYNEVVEIDLVTVLNKIDEVSVSSDEGFHGGDEIIAAEFIHSPVVIDSLVFVPEVIMTCGFEGSVDSRVQSGVRQDRVMTTSMNYQSSRWMESPLSHTESFDFTKPVVGNVAGLKVFSGPVIVIKLFGEPIQEVRASGYYYIQAGMNGSAPSWKLSAGTDGRNTVKTGILGIRTDHSLDLAIQQSDLADSESR